MVVNSVTLATAGPGRARRETAAAVGVPCWTPTPDGQLLVDRADLVGAAARVREPLYVVHDSRLGHVAATGGRIVSGAPGGEFWPLLGLLPGIFPEWLGDRGFSEVHGTRFPYIVGEMARGIASPRMVVEAARAGFMGFYGSAGLRLPAIAAGLAEIKAALGPALTNWGANLIHSPNEPGLEMATVDLFLQQGLRAVSASAFMTLAPSIVRFAAQGLIRDSQGTVRRRGAVFAKVSRPELAAQFMKPAPERLLRELVAAGHLTAQEAELAALVPVAEDITVEADSGGHTDNRPLTAVLPTVLRLRDDLVAAQACARAIRVGAAGGLGTPGAIAGAFALGADYVLTGSINQVAAESGLSEDARSLLAAAEIADVTMAPAADMFELGVQVQVLKRGTLFAQRARRLWEVYRSHDSLEAIAPDVRARLEKEVFRAPLADIWAATRAHFAASDPREAGRGEADPRHRMALVFRWYLFMGAQWAREGNPDRRADYQIWCGPAMGAFNAWTRGSFLERPEHRTVAQIGRNLLEGATVVARAQQLRAAGVGVPATAFDFRPRVLQ